MYTRMRITMILLIALLGFPLLATGAVLFVDDLEEDTIGEAPKKWEHLEFAAGNTPITVVQDPTNPGNKVVETTGIGIYIPKVAGRENWRDYYWEFDWMWENDSYVGTIYRVEGAEAHYHGSRRVGAVDVKIYTRKDGTWAEIATGQYPNENNVWYKHQLIIKGDKHEIRFKKSDDETPFGESDPVVEVTDGTFSSGPVGIMGITEGAAYYDNIIVYEEPADLTTAVSPSGKLAQTWGSIKRQ